MSDEGEDFTIGSNLWPGLAKLMEESGELVQVLAKIIAFPHDRLHPDGSVLLLRLVEELGDVRASMIFFCEANGINKEVVHERADEKLAKFRYWHGKAQE